MKVKIKSIERQYFMSDREYAWILQHLNEPLNVVSIFFNSEGVVDTIGVSNDIGSVVLTIFVVDYGGYDNTKCNGVKYEFVTELPMAN